MAEVASATKKRYSRCKRSIVLITHTDWARFVFMNRRNGARYTVKISCVQRYSSNSNELERVLKIKGFVTDFDSRLGLVGNPGQVVTLKFQNLQVNMIIRIFFAMYYGEHAHW